MSSTRSTGTRILGGTETRIARTNKIAQDLKQRISVDPHILSGKPAVKGTRVPASLLLNLLANGHSFAEIVDAHPILSEDDIRGALLYAGAVLDNVNSDLDDEAGSTWLRAELQIGLDQVARGEYVELTPALTQRLSEEAEQNAREGKPIKDAVLPPRSPLARSWR